MNGAGSSIRIRLHVPIIQYFTLIDVYNYILIELVKFTARTNTNFHTINPMISRNPLRVLAYLV